MTNEPLLALYVKTTDFTTEGKTNQLLDLLKRADGIGYNTLIAWDNYHARPQPSSSYPAASELQKTLADLGWRLFVQTAYTGQFMGQRGARMESNVSGDDAVICLADERVFGLWEADAKRLREWWPDAAGVLLAYDEMRGQGSHPECRTWQGKYGQLLAAHASRAIALHRKVNPAWEIALWSDMFDPSENARPGDYKNVKGGWGGSWDGIDPGCLILNWDTKGDTLREAFQYFDGRGNRQVYCGFYDGPDGDGVSAGEEQGPGYLGDAVKLPSLVGYCYTSWEDDFGQIDRYFPKGLVAQMKPWVPVAAGPDPKPPPVLPPPGPQPTATLEERVAELESAFDGLVGRVAALERA